MRLPEGGHRRVGYLEVGGIGPVRGAKRLGEWMTPALSEAEGMVFQIDGLPTATTLCWSLLSASMGTVSASLNLRR